MIEFDYILKRNEGDEERTFKPDKIPTKLDNLVYIEGPNSSGKSTLLHIISLGFYGLKNPGIPNSLKDKMKSLIDTEYQELTFKIEITGKNDLLKLVAEKNDPLKTRIDVYEIDDGKKKLISAELFEKKYNLIYDIPIDPTSRLKQLTEDVQRAQLRYGSRVGELKTYVRGIIEEIKHSKDPNRIEQLKNNRDNTQKDITVLIKTKNKIDHDKDILEKYTFHRFYYYYRSEVERLNKDIKIKESSHKKEVTHKKKINRQHYSLLLNLKVAIKEMQERFDEITTYLRNLLPPSEKHRLDIWEGIDLRSAISEFQFQEKLTIELIHFRGILKKEREEKINEETRKMAKFYLILTELLQSFPDLEITMPGGKSISEFAQEINDMKKKYDHIMVSDNNFEKSIDLINNLYHQKNDIESGILSKLRQIRQELPQDSLEECDQSMQEDELDDLKRQSQYSLNKFNYYENEWIKKGRPSHDEISIDQNTWKMFINHTEDQLKTEISKMEEDTYDKDSDIKKLDTLCNRLKIQIEELEKQKEHPYRKYHDSLDKLLETIESLEQKIRRDFDENIKEIIEKNASHSDDKYKERYYKAIFTYIAKKIGYIRHLSDEYKIEYIDLIDQYIKTDKGKIIRFLDMGTGQGQSTYLLGRLNTNDERKIIALFDEVAMMDSASLNPIYNRFRELYDDDLMLSGIVVQRADNINIISKLVK
jgi:DNA repair protein SbcC/Rad50